MGDNEGDGSSNDSSSLTEGSVAGAVTGAAVGLMGDSSSGEGPGGESGSDRQALLDNPISDEDLLNQVFDMFYPNMAKPPSTGVAKQFAAKLLFAAVKSARDFDWVPRPPDDEPSIGWAFGEIFKGAWRRLKDNGVYKQIAARVGVNFASEYRSVREGAEIEQ